MYIAEHHNNYLHCTVSIAYIVNQQASTESWQCYRSGYVNILCDMLISWQKDSHWSSNWSVVI